VQSHANKKHAIHSLKKLKLQTEEIVKEFEDALEEAPAREKPFLKERLNDLKEVLESVELAGANCDEREYDIGHLIEVCHGLVKVIDALKNEIGLGSYLRSHRKQLSTLSHEVESACIEPLSCVELSLLPLENYGLYSKACEIYKEIRTKGNLLNMVESLIGFQFMGTSFINHVLSVGTGFSNKTDEYLDNVLNRMPPFEITKVPFDGADSEDLNKKVGARHVWLIKPNDFRVLCGDYKNIYKNGILDGMAL